MNSLIEPKYQIRQIYSQFSARRSFISDTIRYQSIKLLSKIPNIYKTIYILIKCQQLKLSMRGRKRCRLAVYISVRIIIAGSRSYRAFRVAKNDSSRQIQPQNHVPGPFCAVLVGTFSEVRC